LPLPWTVGLEPASQDSASVPPVSSHPIRVLIADDHAVVREGLASIIVGETDMRLAGKAANGEEAVALWQSLKPDIGLFDLRMPLVDAVEAIKRIRAADDSAKVIIITTFDGDEDIYRALRAGAKGYILKDATMEQIGACIRAVNAGKPFIPPPIAEKLATRMYFDDLSPREVEILQLMARGASNKDIAARLSVSLATVKFHVNNVMTKLGANSRTEAVAIAAKRGLVRTD
jgi:two-component system, NarL family, response regulator